MRKLFAIIPLFASVAIAAANISARADGRVLFVNEVATIHFADQAGGMDGSDRARLIAQNLSNFGQDQIRVEQRARSVAILLGQVTILTIDRNESKCYGMSPQALAKRWGRSLQSAIKLPPLRLSTLSVRLAPGVEQSVQLTGSAADTSNAISSDPTVVGVTRTNGTLVLKSGKAGLATITIASANASVILRARVLPYAVYFPQAIEASVTGAPATVDTVRGAIQSAILTKLGKVPGARLRYQVGPIAAIPTGESQVYTAQVRATGPDSVPSEGRVTVRIRNSAIEGRRDQELWFCNQPESVKGPGDLFTATLAPDVPVRMLYHHFNASGSELILRVTAVNPTDEPADLRLIPGDSDPSTNPALAGMRAATQFARNWVCSSGEIVRIPPHSTMPITLRKLYIGQTMSGLCSLRLLSGGADGLRIVASATAPFAMDEAWIAALHSSTPWREVGCQPLAGKYVAELRSSEHIYGKPFLDVAFDYKVGESDAIVRLGSNEIVRHGTHEKLSGNYGVMYNLRTSLENPTKVPVDVKLYFRASGGYSGGLFLIDGNVVQTALLNPTQEVCVATFRVAPGPRRFIMIQTLPLSGCSYPATITLRAVIVPPDPPKPVVPPLEQLGTPKGEKPPVSASTKG